MPMPVKMPRLGESVAEGTIGIWLKKEGEYVEKDESLAEIITDKINAELPSPVAGRLTKILVPVDEPVAIGTDIALIEESVDVKALPTRSAENGVPMLSKQTVQREEEERQRISPLARRLAYEHGINLHDIKGSGIGGRVRKEDILAYLGQRQAALTISTGTIPQHTTVPTTSHTIPEKQEMLQPAAMGEDEEMITPSRMRLAIAEHMVRSKRTSPHATTVVEVDMTNIARWLQRNKEEFKQREGFSLTYVPFVMKAVCAGIRKFPLLNSTWTEDNKIIVKKRINLGIAVATTVGLVVPTVHDADQYALLGLAKQVHALAQRARANKLTIQDMQGSTFVVNNPGVFGTIISMPIINQPHAAIMSMDAVVKRPVVIDEDAIAVRSMMYLCLSFDHRILDGAGAGGFLQAVRTKLQSYGQEIDVY
jgi:pyruvate/2-oxoglutarate dehydrogenase complex dihydrolipoamide acyltransferase (E2) component